MSRVIPDFIVSETATVLKNKNKGDEREAMIFLEVYNENETVEIKSFFENFTEFCDEFVNKENKNLSFVDASLLALHKNGKYKMIFLFNYTNPFKMRS